MEEKHEIVDSVEMLEKTIKQVKKAQTEFAKYSQEQVNKIFQAAAIAANQSRIHVLKWQFKEREWE